MKTEDKVGRVFLDQYARPWVLRAVARDAVFIESQTKVMSIERSFFETMYNEMIGGEI